MVCWLLLARHEICFNQSSKVFISYHRKSVSSLAKFLQAMKSTSVKIHLLWNRVGLCVLGSDCVAKERKEILCKKMRKYTKLFKYDFESLKKLLKLMCQLYSVLAFTWAITESKSSDIGLTHMIDSHMLQNADLALNYCPSSSTSQQGILLVVLYIAYKLLLVCFLQSTPHSGREITVDCNWIHKCIHCVQCCCLWFRHRKKTFPFRHPNL